MQCPGKELLSQYCDIQQEIKEIMEEIDQLERQKTVVLQGVVKGSSPDFPYTPQTFRISGYDEYTRDYIVGEIRRQQTILNERNQRLLQIQTEVEEWIDSIEDSRIRRIFSMRYLEGMSWQQIANQIGGGNTADTCRMAHNRFLKKI